MLERVWRKENPLTLEVSIQIVVTTKENGMEVPKNRGILRSSNHTPGHTFIQKRWTLFKKIHAKKKKLHTCTSALIPALFTIAKTRKQPKCHQQTMEVRRCDVCVLCQSPQSCPTFCNPRDYSPPGSSVHGILQARTLELVAIPFSRASSQPRDGT